jgi:hypothetical protein
MRACPRCRDLRFPAASYSDRSQEKTVAFVPRGSGIAQVRAYGRFSPASRAFSLAGNRGTGAIRLAG